MDSDKEEDSLHTLSEGKIIRDIFLKNLPGGSPFEIGPGDDSAILKRSYGRVVVTTDMLVQDVHFDLAYFHPRHLGEKSILVNLSDIAAMGAKPVAAFIGIGIPSNTTLSFLRDFASGARKILTRYGVSLGGGDTVRADKIVVSVTVIGSINGKAVKRGEAKSGDSIYVSGIPGLSHLGLKLLQRGITGKEKKSTMETRAVNSHLRPTIDVELGCFLREKGIANAMIDTSDGIYNDLGHILEESDKGATVDLSDVPVPPAVKRLALGFGSDWEEIALFGGEDYHLLFTVDPKKEQVLAKWPGKSRLFNIGTIGKKRGFFVKREGRIVRLTDRDKPFFDHFKT